MIKTIVLITAMVMIASAIYIGAVKNKRKLASIICLTASAMSFACVLMPDIA
jgi:uncharacterized membrane protein YwaF